MNAGLQVLEMADKKSNAVRLTREAVEAAKIAAAYRGMTVGDYASHVLIEAARRDIEEGHARWGKTAPPPSPLPAPVPPKRPRKGE